MRVNPYRSPNRLHSSRPGYKVNRLGTIWDKTPEFTVAKGKHTVKLTRDGVPPNLLALRFDSQADIPKDWKATEAKAKLDGVPPRYQTAFLPPDAVNVTTLRLAIKDMTEEFGSRYPNGPLYLEQLSELEKKQASAQNGTPRQRAEIEDSLKSLRREAMLSHPLLDFDRLLFVKRKSWNSCHIYTDYTSNSREMGGNICILKLSTRVGGRARPYAVEDIVPELEEGLFGQFDLSFDAKKVVFSYKKNQESNYRIYEVGIDGSNLKQVTFDEDESSLMKQFHGNYGRYYDVDPCYLPNGRIMFASTRSRRAVSCHPSLVTSIYVVDADGKNMRCLSGGQFTELDPRVMDDGRVIYMRWEYVDKGFGYVQSLWSMRPDGSYSDHVYKNNVVLPAGMSDPRGIPGSQKIVTIGAPHCGTPIGPVVLVDNRTTKRNPEAMTNITPEIAYPGMFQIAKGKGMFRQPYPLSEKLFLVSHDPNVDGEGHYGIYVLDSWGNRAEIDTDPDMSCYQPAPLRPRRMPTEVPSVAKLTTAAKQQQGVMFMQDVYQGMPGIERGTVKYLRVMEVIPTMWNETGGVGAHMQVAAVSYKGDVGRKKIHGIVEVHEDGSACFTVPADTNLFFQALDENYMELQRMRTFINLMPGESRSCIGCHEHRRNAPAPKPAMAMRLPMQQPAPQPGDSGPRLVHYMSDIQPILNKHCVRCHGEKDPKGGLELTDTLTEKFNRSYLNLINRGLVSHLDGGAGAANVHAEPPLTFGSPQSKMVERIQQDPCRGDLTREEFIKIVTWIDADVPFYGTHRGKKDIKCKDEPDFRPLPLAGK